MLNKTFFTDIEHKDKYFRNFLDDVVSSLPLEAKEVSRKIYISIYLKLA
jgi:hypothetical protein